MGYYTITMKMIDYTKKFVQLKRTVLPLLAAVVLTAGLGCAKSDEEAAKKEGRKLVLPVQIGRVVYRDVVDEIRTVGNIRAEQRVMIASEVAGQVLNIPVREGTKVRQGDLLIEIDPRQYQLEVERLRADLISAEKEYEKTIAGLRPEEKEKLQAQMKTDESALELAHKNLQRFEQLVEEGVISQSALDEAIDRARRSEENLRSSKATLAASSRAREEDVLQSKSDYVSVKSKLALAELDLTKSDIVAPFDGVIISKKVEVGTYALRGAPVIEMIGSSRMKADIEMPQSYRAKLDKLREIEFYVQDMDLRFKVKGNFKKRVRVIPDANIFSGNIRVQVELSQPHPALFPGLTLEAILRFDSRQNVLHVPSIALAITEQGMVVYIVKNGTAHLVPVRTFKERDEFVEIVDFTRQLGPDVDLILRGSGAVFPGAQVFTTNPKPKPEVPFNAADTGKKKRPGNKPEKLAR